VANGEFQVREEVLNVLLAELLERRGLWSVPESIRRSAGGDQRRLPDVTLADLSGVRIILEGKFHDSEAERGKVFRAARRRVEEGLSPICVAVLYPPTLRTVRTLAALRRALEAATLEIRVVSEGDDGAWSEANVGTVVEIVGRGYELLVRADVVAQAVADLESALDGAAGVIGAGRGTTERLANLLGIPKETPQDSVEDD
jgi:hypothetical protein